MNKKTIIVSINLVFLVSLCTYFYKKYHKNNHYCNPVTHIVSIMRLEQLLFKCKTKEEIMLILAKHPGIVEKILKLNDKETLEEVTVRMYSMIHNQKMQDLYNEVQVHYCDIKQIEYDLSQAFSAIKKSYPGAKLPQIITLITGMELEFYIDSDLIAIGLDYFLGPKSKYQPYDTPEYLLNTYTYKNIVPKLLLLYCRDYINIDPKDRTLLADMIAYGKVIFFVKSILPNIDEEALLGYSIEQLCEIEENEGIIWDFFLKNKLLFSTDVLKNSSFLDEKEFTVEIHPTCPGAIAKWLGYAIVKSYMKQNPKATVLELLNTQEAQFIFANSKYKPYK